jgi:hypothetical protein
MGVYELMEGKVVNGRGVWQMAGGQEYFMYYGSRPGNFFGSIKKWYISDRADMEAETEVAKKEAEAAKKEPAAKEAAANEAWDAKMNMTDAERAARARRKKAAKNEVEAHWWMKVASTALTPDQIAKTWQVNGGTAKADAPKVRARMCSAEEKRAAAEKLEQERQQAMAAARQVRDSRMLDCI